MNQAEKQQARQYLLGTVSEVVGEQIELRLLSDPEYADEFKILVDQITDEYVKGAFQGEELKQVEQVFFKSAQRREKLHFALALKRLESERRSAARKQSLFKIYLPVAAVVIVAVGLGVWIWKSLYYRSETNDALTALNAAYNNQRPIESRISALRYAPFLSTRGAEDQDVNDAELQRAELTLLNALREQPSPAVHHALGQVYLAKKQFDDAIKQFDEALKGDNTNAVLYSDLGAAWLEKGKVNRLGSEPGKSVEAFARSLDNLDRALELNPNLLEALFNRAIVHQYQMLPDNAESDWQQYLNKDSSSGWANEARANLKALQDQKSKSRGSNEDSKSDFLISFQARDNVRGWDLVRYNRNSATHGNLVREQLLNDYLQSSAAGEKEQAHKILQALTFAGQLELDQTHDVYTFQLARFYANTTSQQRTVLTNARQLMTLAQGYHSQSKPGEALPLFEKSREMFAGVGDLWEASLAELWVGYCYLNTANTARSIGILARLASQFERQGYKWLHMRALHLLSGAEYNLGEYSRAIDHNRSSLTIAQQIDDSRGAFNTLSILVEQYRYIGNYEESLECIQQGLLLLESCDLSPEQTGQYFSIVAAALSSAELFRAAADYQHAALQVMLKTGQAQTISRAYANLGVIYGQFGKYEEALKQAIQGYDTAKSLSDERVRKGMMAYAAQRIGDLYRQAGDSPRAIQSYAECLSLYQSLENYYGVYEAHKSLLLSHLSAGDDVAAGKEIEATLALMEQYRSQILEQNNRNHFFELEQSVYDLAIDYEFSRKSDFEKAFNYSETSRSRSLLDLVNSKGTLSPDTSGANKTDIIFHSISQPLTLRDVQAQMPPEAQVVQYAVLKDKLLIWLVSKTSLNAFMSPITQDVLQRKVSRYVELVSNASSSEDEITHAAKELFDSLIRPIESLLDKQRIIYFVPDKVLNAIPFSALVSPYSGRFLVQDYSVATAPSATLFINSSNLARERADATAERILSVGNPRFSGAEYPTLDDLPAAKREAEEVARFYNSRAVLTETRATKLAVQTEMQRAGVIHFAVHSVLNPHLPLYSKLVLADQQRSKHQESDSNDLAARDIYQMNFAQTRLVVMSSCESGLGKYYGGEGVMSLARPFLAANIPLVVVSLWPVDSETTAELMINFHKHRKRENVSTVEALRRAQLDLLNRGSDKSRRVYSWAAFATVGGWAEF